MPKIVCISDTHGYFMQPPAGDILIHAGDITEYGKLHELLKFNALMGHTDHKHRFAIPGNHDWVCERDWDIAKNMCTNINLCCDEQREVMGLKFYFMPWSPNFYDWAFMLDRRSEELKAKVDAIPLDTEVLVTHSPAWGYQDSSIATDFKARGCELLREKVDRMPNLKLCVSGHIHGGYGQQKDHGTIFVNAAQMNEKYQPVNKPIVVELP